MKNKTCGECKYYNPLSSLCIIKGGKVAASVARCHITASSEVLEDTLAYKIAMIDKTVIASVERLKEVEK